MRYNPRELEKTILDLWNKKSIFIIKGPRRSGKTTLMKRLQEEKGGIYITMEDPNEREDFLSDPINYVKDYIDEPIYLDEIQYTGERGARALKLIYDQLGPHKIVVSGSGAFDVKMKLTAYLVGRAYFFELLPLSFKEYIMWKRPNLGKTYLRGHEAVENLLEGKSVELPPPSKRLERLLSEYLITGGYPEVVLKGTTELMNIVNTTIEEDIIHYFGLKESLRVWEVIKKLALLEASLLNYNTLGVSFKTAEEYLAIFHYSYILRFLRPYSTNPLVELTKKPKIHFIDLGFRNAVINNFNRIEDRVDRGSLYEGFIFRQLWGKNIGYWRTKNKSEVDFVIRSPKVIPIEVKSGKARLTRSLYGFVEKYKPPLAVIVGDEPSVSKRNVQIYTVPAYYF